MNLVFLKIIFTHLPPVGSYVSLLTRSDETPTSGMSNYRVGAFEALEWVWHMLRSFRDSPGGVEEARRAIQEVLADMGNGNDMDFSQNITRLSSPT